MLMTACVENLIHISVLPDGKYSIKYNSVGDKIDLENKDFVHPKNSELVKWATTMTFLDEKDVISKNLNWEKETISTEPINKKMSFTDSQSLIYSIGVDKKGYFFWDRYSFKSTVNSLAIDKKYPSIVEYLDIEADSLSWIVPAKKYIIKKSLTEYDKQADLNIIFVERVNNQIDSYSSQFHQNHLVDKIKTLLSYYFISFEALISPLIVISISCFAFVLIELLYYFNISKMKSNFLIFNKYISSNKHA